MDKISETAYLVALHRALESERSDALFHDPFARLLLGNRGQQLTYILGDQERNRDAIAIRTRVMDDLILKLVGTGEVNLVLNLGAGLDTRPYRLPLPPSLNWVEVDLPDLMAEKERKLQLHRPQCRLQRVSLDLVNTRFRQELLDQVNATAKQTLVITEGLLGYLSEAQVTQLAEDLQRQCNLRWWLFELLPPLFLQQWQQSNEGKIYRDYFNQGRPAFKFAPEQGTKFFQALGWEVSELRSLWTAARQFQRLHGQLKVLAPCLRWFAPQSWQAMTEGSSIVMLEHATSHGTLDPNPAAPGALMAAV
ncbi:Putative S-adenosyl-L-methionine-dependent methyltransferase [Acaryochloris thomasi RCC1774]|uniref:S-adenosyl-L-methionine-dependent methyltransferase n=1 Tax=Acaryochloris thomasi RCC1774 TaxID=1764569 RepID=A0A2W1JBY0_9CYAN|nr:SAM-dependent methyltransferase [Acaryochloris thomasi]PZD71540.1 Putative S-adenosyl-L-methionine-dependent methyltransferase [Acaryochloris thomasi RCC1774]